MSFVSFHNITILDVNIWFKFYIKHFSIRCFLCFIFVLLYFKFQAFSLSLFHLYGRCRCTIFFIQNFTQFCFISYQFVCFYFSLVTVSVAGPSSFFIPRHFFNSMFCDAIAMYSQFVIVYTSLHVRFVSNTLGNGEKEWKSDLIQFYGKRTAFQMEIFSLLSDDKDFDSLCFVYSIRLDFVWISSCRIVIWICMFANRMILRALIYRYVYSAMYNACSVVCDQVRRIVTSRMDGGHTKRWRLERLFGARPHSKSQFSSISSFRWSKQ